MKTTLLPAIAAVVVLLFSGTASAVTPTPTPPSVELTPPAAGVTASTHDGNGPANTVDNDLGSRWSAFGQDVWLQFDLGRTRTIRHVTLAVYQGDKRRNVFDLKISEDGHTWVDVLTGTQTPGNSTAAQTYDFPDRLGRYVRYVGHGHISGGTTLFWNSLTEVDIYGSDPGSGLPQAPSGLRAQPGAGRVTLAWNVVPGVSSYRVWRRSSGCNTYVLVGAATDGSGTFVDNTVTDRQRAYYAVSSVNGQGEGARSAPVAVTPQLPPPPAPSLAASSGPAGITLTWNAEPTAIRYTIRRGERKPHCRYFVNNWQVLATVDAPAARFVDTALHSGRTYVYSVSTTNVTGDGPQSLQRDAVAPGTPVPTPSETPCPTPTATPTPGPPTATPQPPVNVAATPGDQRVWLSWQGAGTYPNFPRGYSIYRADSACGPFVPVAWSVAAAGYTVTGLENGRTYFFMVAGVNALGESLDSTIVTGTPQAVPPTAPPNRVGVAMRSPNEPTVRVSWWPSWDASTVSLRRASASGGPYAVIATLPSDPNHAPVWYDDSAVSFGTTYYYSLVSINGAGSSTPSAPVSIMPAHFPAAPTNLTAAPGNAQVTLSWSAVPTAVTYGCRYGTAPGGPFWSSTVPVTTTSTTVTRLGNGITYHFICWANNAAGSGPATSPVSATPR